MGFDYAIGVHGRQCLCCDFCGGFRGDTKGTKYVKKIACLYEYCQAWATCDNCKIKGMHKLRSSADPTKDGEGHYSCKVGMENNYVNKVILKA